MADVDLNKLKAAFAEYDNADAAWKAQKDKLAAAAKLRSDFVEKILAANNGQKKIRRNGVEMTIVIKGSTHFFRGPKAGGDDITEV